MFLQRGGNERFKDISIEFSNDNSVDFSLSNRKVWEEIGLEEVNTATNFVKISAINVHNKINNGFAELKVFGCASGMTTYCERIS